MTAQKRLRTENGGFQAARDFKKCTEERNDGRLVVPLTASVRRTAYLTGVSESTVSRILNKPDEEAPRKPRHDKQQLDDFDECVVRRTVREMLTISKILPTVTSLHKILQEKIRYNGGKEHLRLTLLKLGFNWKPIASNRKILIERPDIISLRVQFLRRMKKLREAGRHIVYTDETYIHAGHTSKRCWQSDEIKHYTPFNKGDRIIIVHAGSKDGFIKGADLIFKSKTKSGDYHDDMNFENFRRWLEERLIPNLQPNSIVVLDNAPYHSKQEDRCPTMACKKADMQSWLTRNHIPFQDGMLKAELLQLCKQNKPNPKYVVDHILKSHGHECIRLPPYHADLNAIELIWANVKRTVAAMNFSFKINDIIKHTEEAFTRVTEEHWHSCCQHVEEMEQKYWVEDIAVEEEIEKVEFYVCSSDEGTDTASEGDNSETDTADEA